MARKRNIEDGGLSNLDMAVIKHFALHRGTYSDSWRHGHPDDKSKKGSISNKASKFFKQENVQKEVAKIRDAALEDLTFSINKVLEETARIAFADFRDLFDETGALLDVNQWSDRTASSVAAIEVTTDRDGLTTTKIKLWNKDTALEKLFKHLGMYDLDNNQKNPFTEKFDKIDTDSMALMLEKLNNVGKKEASKETSKEIPEGGGGSGLDGKSRPRRARITTK